MFKGAIGGSGAAAPQGAKRARGPATAQGSGGGASALGPDSDKRMLCLAKGQLNIFGRIRTVEAGTQKTYTGDKTHQYFSAPEEAIKNYSDTAKAQGRGHKLGSPHAHGAAAMINAMSDTSIEDHERKILTDFQQIAGDVAAVGTHIPIFRVSPCHDNNLFKIRITFSAEAQEVNLHKLVNKLMIAMGAELKTGDAPRGPNERELMTLFPELKLNDNMIEV